MLLIVLGLLIAKSKVNSRVPFKCFTKLYDALVMSIITCGFAILVFSNFNCINNVHNRECTHFLAVSKHTTYAGVLGETGWKRHF